MNVPKRNPQHFGNGVTLKVGRLKFKAHKVILVAVDVLALAERHSVETRRQSMNNR
jgi:hypothetical protein